jgi:mRNA interferase RelE/StbE
VSLRVRWDRAAEDALRALARRNPATARRIGAAGDRYAETGSGDVRKLRGSADEWRLRVGDWRVIFTFDPPGTITVLTVAPRRDVYRR